MRGWKKYMTAKLMKFSIPLDILIEMLTTNKRTEMQCLTGLPVGTRFISSYVDVNTMLVYLVVEHESFKELEIGQPIPQVTIRLAPLMPEVV